MEDKIGKWRPGFLLVLIKPIYLSQTTLHLIFPRVMPQSGCTWLWRGQAAPASNVMMLRGDFLGGNFLKVPESNWVLYCNIWLQSNSRGPADVWLGTAGALFLQTSPWSGLNYQSYLAVSCSETLHNKTSITEPPWGRDFREEWGISLFCFPAGKIVSTGNVFLPLYAFVWRQGRFYHSLLLLPNCGIKYFICISYTIFTVYEE